ncbi:hypothetical protein KBD45_06300 [Candidatus Dojkabacteria bacterium]|nr:hypothetical protein [Candidatus Dojkabacteria bacterium]
MLRVASLGKIISKNWIGALVDNEAILMTCLFHDIAKPITFDPQQQSKYGMNEGQIQDLIRSQKILIKKYGPTEHNATLAISKEVGLNEETLRALDNFEWGNLTRLFEQNDLNSLIPLYCDMRIGLKGILSSEERLADLNQRIENKNHNDHLKDGILLKDVVEKNVNINLNEISDEQINANFEYLTNYIINPHN